MTVAQRLLPWLFSALLLAGCSPDAEKKSTVPKVAPDETTASAEESTVPVPVPVPVTSEPSGIDKSDPSWKQQLTKPDLMEFDADTSIFWELETNMGSMSFRLFHDSAPMHASSTIYLTDLGFYDSVIFHRVIPGFMAQGGDPTGTGRGNPGYAYDGEFDGGRSHDKPGLLSMANAGPSTDGSQFFITFVPTPFLDGKHTIFGELVSGLETLKELEKRGSRGGSTSEKLEIIKATITRN